jgi:hypothetical protein
MCTYRSKPLKKKVLSVIRAVYIPQDGRFLIYEDFGCSAFVSHTSVGVVLAVGPRVLIFFACAVYSCALASEFRLIHPFL